MSVFFLKTVMALAIFTTNLLSGFMTFGVVKLAIRKWFKVAGAVANALTGGLFFGIIFLLLQPEIGPAEADLRKKYKISFPIPFGPILIVFGIILLMLLDAFLHKLTGGHHGHSHSITPHIDDSEGGLKDVDAKNETKLHKYVIFTTLMALHSLSEGIPLGYKKESSEIYAYFWPLFLHKILEAMSVACAGLHEKPKYAITGTTIHSIMTPLGVAIGFGIVNLESSFITDFIILVLMGLSTGALIYITFVEVMAPEVENESISALTKTALVTMGFLGTTTIAAFIGILEEH